MKGFTEQIHKQYAITGALQTNKGGLLTHQLWGRADIGFRAGQAPSPGRQAGEGLTVTEGGTEPSV